MEQEIRALIQIESATGTGSQGVKAEILQKHNTPVMRKILDVAFNPFVTTKLHKIDLFPFSQQVEECFEKFSEFADHLNSIPSANDELRSRVSKFISNCHPDPEVREMMRKILTKTVNIGIGAKSINKALGQNLIPDPSLMLATDEHETIEKWPTQFCEEKYDGVRVIAVFDPKKKGVEFYTRAFNAIPGVYLEKITQDILSLLAASDVDFECFLDGELTDLNRKSVSGKVTQMLKGAPSPSIQEGILYNIFDFETIKSLRSGKGMLPFHLRRKALESLFEKGVNPATLILANSYETRTIAEIQKIYKEIVSQGGEGVIVKNPQHVYECKRSKNWVKFKEVLECDLIITGWYPGEGKRTGLIGGFCCQDASGKFQVNVGSGFTDNDLQTISKNPEQYVGKIASIQYNALIEDKHGNKSLFLPRLSEIRLDKTQADTLSL
jgi:DNA ligase 1